MLHGGGTRPTSPGRGCCGLPRPASTPPPAGRCTGALVVQPRRKGLLCLLVKEG
ncbi:hypothetical protein E2C01_072610 [Portunus trituberculatus]|uniref:Uncharacterized protein n=1 Tax=Portunus trituberculatus TaxID=210409 RepID=A0A5B7I0B9_PORTR|nr:hypothetical protein [Portunus trituberculatus]